MRSSLSPGTVFCFYFSGYLLCSAPVLLQIMSLLAVMSCNPSTDSGILPGSPRILNRIQWSLHSHFRRFAHGNHNQGMSEPDIAQEMTKILIGLVPSVSIAQYILQIQRNSLSMSGCFPGFFFCKPVCFSSGLWNGFPGRISPDQTTNQDINWNAYTRGLLPSEPGFRQCVLPNPDINLSTTGPDGYKLLDNRPCNPI